jgi:SAM-dependent methyltransferase
MPSSEGDWNEKYRLAADMSAAEPASIVCELLPLLPKGPALDIACGSGRHSMLLAERGQQVTAVDWSGVGLDLLEARARAARIPVTRIRALDERRDEVRDAHHGEIALLREDLERIALPKQCYELILCIQYLQRSLFAQMTGALRPGGMLLLETFTEAQREFAGGPRSPEHLLHVGELRDAFPKLQTLFYRELRAGQGIASLLAQKPGKDN